MVPQPLWPSILFKALLGHFPIDNIPDGTEVFGFAVFILETKIDDISELAAGL